MKIQPTKDKPVIAWWSGGATSAVTCKLCIDCFGKENVRVIFIDTGNEDPDTYRFMMDCEEWYGTDIETIRNPEYDTIEDVWFKYNSLNVAHGAICSSELKRKVRVDFEKENEFTAQAFGFEYSKKELNRAKGMKYNNPSSKPIFPLISKHIDKEGALLYIADAGLRVPNTYLLGFNNNNCFQTGCVQGGIGYWQKIKEEHPEKFEYMASIEHELTERKGEPVTMLKDQSKKANKLAKEHDNDEYKLLFLKPHPDYPHIKDISQKKGRRPKPMMECNGFCGSEDLQNPEDTSMSELNLQQLEMEF